MKNPEWCCVSLPQWIAFKIEAVLQEEQNVKQTENEEGFLC